MADCATLPYHAGDPANPGYMHDVFARVGGTLLGEGGRGGGGVRINAPIFWTQVGVSLVMNPSFLEFEKNM